MHRQFVFSVYDVKAAIWSTPTFYINDDVAVRSFSMAVNDRSSVIGFEPESFSLYCVGEFDSASGKLSGCDPRLVITGVQLKEVA